MQVKLKLIDSLVKLIFKKKYHFHTFKTNEKSKLIAKSISSVVVHQNINFYY